MATMSSLKRGASQLSSPVGDAKKPKANSSITSFFSVPKSNGSTAATGAPRPSFNKARWVQSLTPDQKDLLRLEIDTLDDSWLLHLKDEITTPEFLNLKRFLKKEKESGQTIFPPENEIYSWSKHTPLHSVKAVILGQDPYHNPGQAHGLCFSVKAPTVAPPSLKNIYTCLQNDYPSFQPPPNKGGLLIPWAERGVLMLNTCLTVRARNANSHSNKGWERFTQKVIDTVSRVRTHGVVFLAWGTPAGKRISKVDRSRHCILQSVHPSPLSAHGGFFTCGHFKKCNEWLASRYGADSQIDWSLSPRISVLESRQTAPSLIVKEQTTKKNSSELSAKTTKVDAIAKAQLETQNEDAEAIAAMVAAEDDLDDLDDLEENVDTVAGEEELVTTTEEK